MDVNLNILKSSNDNNKLTVFVGAGVSKSSNLPSWDELISILKKELSISNDEKDYLKIAQLYYLSCGETVYFQKIKEYFPENIEPTIIQKLIFDLNPANIITTNWDELLEKTSQNNGLIYDVIYKDEHLVQSKMQKHIIKMHGDFKGNNIVFKEDDYINYKYNFPLIENYVKSILSTNTILFVGYSYSDINLKQISKWIQNNSKSMPPMFLVVFKEDKNQSKYLENFGIKTIVLNKEEDFGLDGYSNKLATFLRQLNTPAEDLIEVESLSEIEIVKFIYDKLNPLDKLNAILLQQIQTTLTNCGYVYEQEGNLILLEFYKETLTYDINEKRRLIFDRFKEIFKKENLSYEITLLINKIIIILYKANIDGIIIGDDLTQSKLYYTFPFSRRYINGNLKKLCNYEFNDFSKNSNNIIELMAEAFFHYQKFEYIEAYRLNEKIILQCLRQQEHVQLFLALFNHNVLLGKIKNPFFLEDTNNSTKYEQAKINMNLKAYDLDERFYDLPKPIQKILKDIKPFLSYDYLYRFSSEIDDELNKKLKQKRNIEKSGGVTFDSNIIRNYSKQKNLINFVLNNFIMMERNYDFRVINRKLIQISLIRQMQKNHLTFDKMELFATIKYIQNKELVELLGDFSLDLNISAKNINWLVKKVLPNVTDLFNQNKKTYSLFSDELKNITFLLEKQNLNNFQSNLILRQFKLLISNNKIDLDIYKQINSFIGNQKSISDDEIINIIELMINKIICNKGNLWDYQVIEENRLYNSFNYVNDKISYSNEFLIEKFLRELERYNERQKIQISRGFLIGLYNISNEKIKSLIKNFMLKIDIDKVVNNDDMITSNYGLKITFKLFLLINNFIELSDDLINEVKLYPEKEGNNIYFLGQITGQVKFLVEKLHVENLQDLLTHLMKVIDEVNQRLKGQEMRNII